MAIGQLGPPGGQLFDGLADAGLLVPRGEASDTPTMFANFAGVGVHRAMLGDEVRLEAYRRAIHLTVRPGDVVIDAGSGSGILAVYAALAGAGRVYAIERTDFADVIERVAEDSGVGDIVEVVRGDIGDVQLPQRARVLITETFGHLALAEGALPDLARCAERNLSDDGVTIPHAVTLHAAPWSGPDLLHPFRLREDGVDLSCLRGDAAGRADTGWAQTAHLGPAQDVARIAIPGDGSFVGRLSLDGRCEALCAWFTLHLAPGCDLPTGPSEPRTHWQQTYLPVALPAGDHVIHGTPAPEDRRTLVLEFAGMQVRVR